MLKKILLILLAILAAALCVVYYYFDKITALPEWYEQPEKRVSTGQEDFRKDFDQADLTERSSQIMKKIRAAGAQSHKTKKEKPVSLNAGEFHDLMLGRMLGASDNDSLIRSLKATHVKINQNSIEAGAIVDLSEMSEKALSGKQMKWVKTATSVFPFLKDRAVHVAIEGKPVVEKGKLTFDSESRVSIGEMKMPVSELAEKLGTTVEKLKKKTAVQLDQSGNQQIRIENQLIVFDNP